MAGTFFVQSQLVGIANGGREEYCGYGQKNRDSPHLIETRTLPEYQPLYINAKDRKS
jgi:hypothetical protein